MLDKLNVNDQKRINERVTKLDTSFGTDIKEVLSALEMDMGAFAEQVKISTDALKKLEVGDTRSSLVVSKRIKRFLGIVLALYAAKKMKRLKKDDNVKLDRSTLLHLLPKLDGKNHKKR